MFRGQFVFAMQFYLPSGALSISRGEFKMAVSWGDLEVSADAPSGREGNPLLTCLLYGNTDTGGSYLIQSDWFLRFAKCGASGLFWNWGIPYLDVWVVSEVSSYWRVSAECEFNAVDYSWPLNFGHANAVIVISVQNANTAKGHFSLFSEFFSS